MPPGSRMAGPHVCQKMIPIVIWLRWAYYLLMFLCIVGLVLSMVLLIAAEGIGMVSLGILQILGVTIGACLIALHPDSLEFMDQQRMRFSSES